MVYSIAAVPTATSYTWSVPAGWAINAGQGTLSMTATSGSVGQNGNISVTASNTCGTSTAQTLAVTVVAAAQPPTITLGSNPTVCQGSTSANLPYSATTNSPNQYSIDYNSTANTAGFIDVVNAALSASPIILTVPGGAATGTYFGNLSVKNSTSGLSSGNYSITVQIIATPATPGVIIGSNAVPELTTGITYAIMPVAFATTYTWTVPSGWAITSGQGSNGITVTSGLAGQNGNITVTAGNSCGTSAASTLAVTSQVPTDHSLFGCSACHITHTSPGGAITSTLGNANLCLSCHVTTGVASGKPFTNADKAIPGTSGNSHAWDVAALNSTYETDVPTETQMALRVYSGEIVCSTCHDQHNSNANVSYTRISNTGDAMCKDCHSPRNVGRYLDNPGVNKGSHPVGLAYSGTGDFEATPTGAVTLPGGNVECSSCHQTHYAPTSDGTLLRQANDDALCTSCHTIFASGGTPVGTHNGMNCSRCHQTHNTNKANIYMIRNTIATPNSGNKTVNFTALTGTNSFADGDATYDGVCEVCHTTTNHYRNDGLAPDQSHTSQGGQNGANCMGCHPHNSNFSPAGGCHDCHDSSKPHLYPTNAQGYNEGSHAVHASKYVCSTCHFGHGSGGVSEGSHPSSTINIVFNPAGLAAYNGATPTWNSVNKTCSNVYCHSNAAATPTYTTTPNWNDSNSITTCQPCHVVDIASSVSPGTAAHNKHVGAPYNFTCSTCHNGLNNNSPNHADGTKDVVFDPNGLATRNGADGNSPAWNSGNRNCSQVYCHSTGTTSNRFSEGYAVWNNSASTTAITYATTPNWSTGSITACGSCHAGPVTMPSGPSYTVQEGNNTGLVTASSQYPNTGAHGSNTGAHSSPDQLIILTENATYGNALSHSWPFVQCFWCHNNDAGAASGVPKKQGTYGTSKHVDGLTWYFPSWYGYGGGCEKTSGGQAPPYYTMDTQTECNSLGSGYIWRPEPVDPEKKGSMVPGLGYSWFGPTNEHCGNGKNCW
ncbi:MAG TPA: hypothetical protein DCX54_01440 [Flavobacteriales bacterium]|nr:hypothetical protein [Flavobacteriales bacterium]